MLEPVQLFALSVFFLYFALIGGLFWLIFNSLRRKVSSASSHYATWTFFILAALSALHTWYYMIRYMQWSFHNYQASIVHVVPAPSLLSGISDWLVNTSLFEEAWFTVCATPLNWWWSEQLCLFTVGAWTIFLASKGHDKSVKHVWAYMLLGQVVAISVASNLFYVALTLSPPSKTAKRTIYARPALWLSVLLSLSTIVMLPFMLQQAFLLNLLVMHTLLIIPLLIHSVEASGGTNASRTSVRLRSLYTLVAVAALLLRWRTVSEALTMVRHSRSLRAQSMPNILWNILGSHPAQSSIGWDVIWTTISFFIWTLYDASLRRRLAGRSIAWLIATALASVGVSAPLILSRETQDGESVHEQKNT